MYAKTLLQNLEYAIKHFGEDCEVLIEKEDYSGYNPISSSMCISDVEYIGFDDKHKTAKTALVIEI